MALQEAHLHAGSSARAAAPDNVEVADVHSRLVLNNVELAPMLTNHQALSVSVIRK